MGANCTVPTVDDDDLEITQGKLGADGKHTKVRARLKQQAQELFAAEGARVVIVGAGGEEEPVEEGRLSLLELSAPSRLVVIFVGGSLEDEDRGFYYPLLPATPVCLSGNRVLTLDAGGGDVFGVELPSEFAEGSAQLKALIEVLSKECSLEVKAPPTRAEMIAESLLNSSKKAADSIGRGTDRASEGLRWGGEAVRQRVGKASEESKISEGTKLGVTGLKTVTGSAVVVTGAVVDGLMDLAVEVGKQMGRPADGVLRSDCAVSKVGRAAGAASVQVFDALFRAGDRLVSELCDETAAVVSHRYGQEAGSVAREAMDVGRDVNTVAHTFGRYAASRLTLKASLYTTKGLVEGRTGEQLVPGNGNAAITNKGNASSSRAR